jgi:hypothetical protein
VCEWALEGHYYVHATPITKATMQLHHSPIPTSAYSFKFEDLSLAMFRRINLFYKKNALPPLEKRADTTPNATQANKGSPTIYE